MSDELTEVRDEQPEWSKRDVREIAFGGLVVMVLMFVILFSYLGSSLEARVGEYRVTASFNRIDGLAKSADVLLAGIRVGEVSGLSLDNHYRAVVTMTIDSAVRLPVDTSVAIHTDGLFGSKFVVLDPGGEEDMIEPGDELTYTQDSLVVGELLDLIIAEGRAARQAAADKSKEEAD